MNYDERYKAKLNAAENLNSNSNFANVTTTYNLYYIIYKIRRLSLNIYTYFIYKSFKYFKIIK